ncbi:glycerol-3-phosphate 1-O-acyltransferase PlsY [Waterburya agarophytonicola K14]|uniref:Glycerol-3-phosphate acyltransferase n=1 Tax=Waterburya agarophytonicola KI4 TaxID=2874699 RepID=A0A964BTX2_9CYAN|nr:glycerol-3-phosphate 1-O-acyltransferase PlsY [Waterburya agarophytonicola]MCC0179749.1 glycerol-3-phosphate 1-O-acyltransferase PlsY [Waterburya agarophytonicola KI4]
MRFDFIVGGLLILAAYLLGSIPTGYAVGRYLKGIDIREHGSGSTGATNVLRTVGKPAALVVLAIDLLKGAIALAVVNLVYSLAPSGFLPPDWHPWLITAAALSAIIGHSKSIWLNFTGGKSVATTLGILLVMNPLVALGTVMTFAVTLGISRIVSLSSICGAIAVNVLIVALNQPPAYSVFAVLAGLYVILRHKTNIQRLVAGIEPKIGQAL